LKLASPFRSAAVIAATAAALAIAASAQAPSHPPAPAPTNLQVLPKDMTGEQVHELMHKWEASLGTECSTCHAADPNRKMPNGRPALNFADDSKPEKKTARLMAQMVQEINSQYIKKLDDAEPVTCATCHRGHLEPPAFVPPPEHEHHDHDAPPAGAKPSSGQ
jgi:cytochrome c553